MKPKITEEVVRSIIRSQGSSCSDKHVLFVKSGRSVIEMITDVCQAVANEAYEQGNLDVLCIPDKQHAFYVTYKSAMDNVKLLRRQNEECTKELEEAMRYIAQLQTENQQLSKAAVKQPKSPAQQISEAILTIQNAVIDGHNAKIMVEINEEHCWLCYGDMKFLVSSDGVDTVYDAIRACVLLSGLEVD